VLKKIKRLGPVDPRERQVPRWLRFEILKRDGFRCRYCGAKGVPLQVDHIKPVIQGGLTEPKNLTTACDECNGGKGGVPLEACRI
jgi:5-methylcytosine-specific restriction endonuclease McrA